MPKTALRNTLIKLLQSSRKLCQLLIIFSQGKAFIKKIQQHTNYNRYMYYTYHSRPKLDVCQTLYVIFSKETTIFSLDRRYTFLKRPLCCAYQLIRKPSTRRPLNHSFKGTGHLR